MKAQGDAWVSRKAKGDRIMRVIYKITYDYGNKPIEASLKDFIEHQLGDVHGYSGQIESLCAELSKLKEFLARLTAKLVDDRTLTLQNVKDLLSYYGDVKEVK